MIYKCDVCNCETNNKNNYEKHLLTQKHKQNVYQSNNCNKSNQKLSEKLSLDNKSDNSIEKNGKVSQLHMDNDTIKLEPLIQNSNNNKYQCSNCKSIFAYKSGLSRHKNKCKNVRNNIECEETDNIKLKYELELQKKELELYKKELESKYEIQLREQKIQLLEKQIEQKDESEHFHQKVIEYNNKNMDGLIQNNMKAITFLNLFYDKGPCLESFNKNFKDPYIFYVDSDNSNMKYDGENFIINDITMHKDEFISDLIVNLYDLNTDVQYYITKIVEYYKNDKFPELQAMWVSDSYRNNYNVKLKITDNISRWQVDKNGLIATEKILVPMFEFTCGILQKTKDKYKVELDSATKERDVVNALKYSKKMASLAGFIDKVNKKEIQPQIMKALASHFYLDVSKHKLLQESKKKMEFN